MSNNSFLVYLFIRNASEPSCFWQIFGIFLAVENNSSIGRIVTHTRSEGVQLLKKPENHRCAGKI